jgi:ribosomal protein S18 acetylase RimI-like enzyme
MTAGLAIRQATTADASALATLFVEAWRDQMAGLLPAPVLAARSRAESETNWRRTLGRSGPEDPFVLVAGEPPFAGLIVGVLQAPEWPGAAEVSVIQVAVAFRRRGVGAALMRETAGRLRRSGATSLIVRVIEVNARARAFYEALGGALTPAVRWIDESGVDFAERTYLWPDIGQLAGRR